jgi:hypothetical protein
LQAQYLLCASDARWFTREEVLGILHGKSGSLLSQSDYNKLTDKHEGNDDTSLNTSAPAQPAAIEQPIKFPPNTSIGSVLIAHWADGKVTFSAKESNSWRSLAGHL